MYRDAKSILHVITGVDKGGAEIQLLNLTEGLVERGFDVTVAYLKGSGELVERFEDVGCSVVKIPIRHDVDPIGFLQMVDHVRANEYDIVHGHLFHGNVYGVFGATLTGVPTIISSKHNDPPFWRRQPYKQVHKISISYCDHVVPISDHVNEYFREQTGTAADKTTVIRYGLDPGPFERVIPSDVQRVRDEFGVTDVPLVGTVGRLSEQKGIDILLKGFQSVITTWPEAHLVIVGRGDRETEYRRMATELNIDEQVTFAGFREDVPQLMAAFDIFALPSRWEGLGVVFLEAMAAGTPIVATDTSAIPEVVDHNSTGILVPIDDSKSLATAIIELLNNPDRAARMGDKGQQRVRSEFSVERMVNEMIDVYDSITGS